MPIIDWKGFITYHGVAHFFFNLTKRHTRPSQRNLPSLTPFLTWSHLALHSSMLLSAQIHHCIILIRTWFCTSALLKLRYHRIALDKLKCVLAKFGTLLEFQGHLVVCVGIWAILVTSLDQVNGLAHLCHIMVDISQMILHIKWVRPTAHPLLFPSLGNTIWIDAAMPSVDAANVLIYEIDGSAIWISVSMILIWFSLWYLLNGF